MKRLCKLIVGGLIIGALPFGSVFAINNLGEEKGAIWASDALISYCGTNGSLALYLTEYMVGSSNGYAVEPTNKFVDGQCGNPNEVNKNVISYWSGNGSASSCTNNDYGLLITVPKCAGGALASSTIKILNAATYAPNTPANGSVLVPSCNGYLSIDQSTSPAKLVYQDDPNCTVYTQ